MLLFIQTVMADFIMLGQFQYISCYSLSQVLSSCLGILASFQYISCYSLSLWQRFSLLYKSIVSIHLMLLFIIFWRHCYFQFHLFQYISCYSLSTRAVFTISRVGCFNTSHVTLYPSPAASSELPGTVSIHLMSVSYTHLTLPTIA